MGIEAHILGWHKFKNRMNLVSLAPILRKRYCSFLLHERNAPPYCFFLLLLTLFQPIPPSLQWLLVAASLLLPAVDCNVVFLAAPLAGGVMGVVAMVLGVVWANEKWKMSLLVFHVGARAAAAGGLLHYYLPVGCAIMCLTIYVRLWFSSLSDNTQYFVGFFLLSLYSSDQIDGVLLVASPLLLAVGYKVISSRLASIYSQPWRQIKDGRLLAFWLRKMESSQQEVGLRLREHRSSCGSGSCYCRGKDEQEIGRYLVREIIEWGLGQREMGCDEQLLELHFQNLIKNGQLMHSLYFLKQMQSWSHLPRVSLRRAEGKINQMLELATFDKPYGEQYTAALQYDHLHLKFVTQIHCLIDLKLAFWRETQSQHPRPHFLSSRGLSFTHQLHELHCLYNSCVRPAENCLSAFDVSVLYAMFLTSATNFGEQAQIILKRASRAQQRDNALGNYCDTHALRTYVHANRNCYAKDQNLLQFEESSQGSSTPRQPPTHSTPALSKTQQQDGGKGEGASYKLIVDMVSNGLLRLLNLHKVDLIGEELNRIIPEGYKEVHNVRLQNLFAFDRPYRQIAASKVLHSELVLPMRASEDNLLYAMIYIKVVQDIEKGLTFVSVVRKREETSGHALLELGGYITERSHNFNDSILLHPEFARYLEAANKQWEASQTIPEETFSIVINSINYTVTLNSPLVVLFLDKFEQLSIQQPPLHVEVRHQMVIKTSKERGLAVMGDKGVNQQQQTISSKANTSSINVLLDFERKGRVALFTRISFIFLAGMGVCGVGLVVSGLVSGLGWDNSTATANPIYDAARMMQLQTYTLHALIDLRQLSQFKSNSSYNFTRTAQYTQIITSSIEHTKQSLQRDLQHLLDSPSSLLQPLIHQALAYHINASFQSPLYTIQITYLELVLNYLLDLAAVASGDKAQTLLQKSFEQEIVSLGMRTSSDKIDEEIDQRWKISLSIWATSALLVLLSIVLLKLSLKPRLALHERIYDLFISQDPEMVRTEVDGLQRVKEVMTKWKEEEFRNNVLQFSHQVILTRNHLPAPNTSKAQPIMQFLNRSQAAKNIGTGRRGSVMKERRRSRSASHTLFSSIALKVKQDLQDIHNFGQKRGKELQWEGSQYDPSKICFPLHLLLYLCLALTIFFLLGLALTHQSSFFSTLSHKSTILSSLYEHNQQSLALIYALQELRPTHSQLKILPPWDIKEQSSSALKQVVDRATSISQMQEFDYLKIQNLNSLQLQNANNNNSQNQNYNNLLLLGQYTTLFASIYEQIIKLGKIDVNMFQLQNLFRAIRQLALRGVSTQLNLMNAQFSQTNTNVLQILLWGAFYCLAGLVFGGLTVWMLRNKYVNEVCLVSLLSGRMLGGNKRVGTFIAGLALSGQ